MNMWKSSKEYTAFLFMGYALWEENIKGRVLLESTFENVV